MPVGPEGTDNAVPELEGEVTESVLGGTDKTVADDDDGSVTELAAVVEVIVILPETVVDAVVGALLPGAVGEVEWLLASVVG